MPFPNLARNLSRASKERDILGHWAWALPVILVVAALAIRQIDINPPTIDELLSMGDAGWIGDDRYTPGEVLYSVSTLSPNHTPLFFLLLNQWGHLTGIDVATGRVLTIFLGLLALCVIYRLGRDFAASPAALFAIIMVASNAFYNYFYAHIRMYSLLVLASSLVLWLYLRVMYKPTAGTRRSSIALFAATILLLYSHPLGALLLLALGIYHLLIAPKNSRWVAASLAAFAATALLLPWLPILLTDGLSALRQYHPQGRATVGEILQMWLSNSFNGSPVLLALAVISIWIAQQKKPSQIRSFHLIAVLFIPIIGLVAYAANFFRTHDMRLLLSSLPALTLMLAFGVATLSRIRKSLGLLVILWIIAGISFQNSPEISTYLTWKGFRFPAWQAVSRLARQMEQRPLFIGYGFRNIELMRTAAGTDISHFSYFFGDWGATVQTAESARGVGDNAATKAISEPVVWVFYRSSVVDLEASSEIESVMEQLKYQLCASTTVGYETVILQFQWAQLACGELEPPSRHQNELLEYELHRLNVDQLEDKVYFVDRWAARIEFAIEEYRFSHQLLDEDWERVAQVDVPLVYDGRLRRFSIDVSDVQPGKYHLAVILYNGQTGERTPWVGNEGYAPEMLALGEILLD